MGKLFPSPQEVQDSRIESAMRDVAARLGQASCIGGVYHVPVVDIQVTPELMEALRQAAEADGWAVKHNEQGAGGSSTFEFRPL